MTINSEKNQKHIICSPWHRVSLTVGFLPIHSYSSSLRLWCACWVVVVWPAVDLLLAVGVARRWWRRPIRYSQLSASALDLEPATTAGAATAKRYNKRSFIGRDEEGDDGCCYGFSIWSREARELLNCLELALMKDYELLGGWSKWWLFLCLHVLGLILLTCDSTCVWLLNKNGGKLPSSARLRGELWEISLSWAEFHGFPLVSTVLLFLIIVSTITWDSVVISLS